MVEVIAGNYKGQTGQVLKVLRLEDRVVVEGVNVKKKHTRPTKAGAKGGIVDITLPIHISNVKLAGESTKAPVAKKAVAKKSATKKTTKKTVDAE